MVVRPSLPVKTVQDLVQLAKSKPGQVNFASSGQGSVIALGYPTSAEAAVVPSSASVCGGDLSAAPAAAPTATPTAQPPAAGADSINLVKLVGPSLLKRVIPVAVAAAGLALLGRWLFRRNAKG